MNPHRSQDLSDVSQSSEITGNFNRRSFFRCSLATIFSSTAIVAVLSAIYSEYKRTEAKKEFTIKLYYEWENLEKSLAKYSQAESNHIIEILKSSKQRFGDTCSVLPQQVDTLLKLTNDVFSYTDEKPVVEKAQYERVLNYIVNTLLYKWSKDQNLDLDMPRPIFTTSYRRSMMRIDTDFDRAMANWGIDIYESNSNADSSINVKTELSKIVDNIGTDSFYPETKERLEKLFPELIQ